MRKSQVMKRREGCGIGGKAFRYVTSATQPQEHEYQFTYARVAGAWVDANVLRPQGETTAVDLRPPLAEGGSLVFRSSPVPSPLGTTVFEVHRSPTHHGVYRLVVTCREGAAPAVDVSTTDP